MKHLSIGKQLAPANCIVWQYRKSTLKLVDHHARPPLPPSSLATKAHLEGQLNVQCYWWSLTWEPHRVGEFDQLRKSLTATQTCLQNVAPPQTPAQDSLQRTLKATWTIMPAPLPHLFTVATHLEGHVDHHVCSSSPPLHSSNAPWRPLWTIMSAPLLHLFTKATHLKGHVDHHVCPLSFAV